MLFILSKIWKPFLIILGVGAIGLLCYWYFSQEYKRELSPVMEELSIRTSRELAHKVPRIQNIENLLVVPVVGGRHEDQHLKNIVVDAIARKRKYTIYTWEGLKEDLEGGSLWQQAIDQMGFVSEHPPKNIAQGKQAAKVLKKANLNIDGILFVKCLFDQGPRDDNLGAIIELKGTLYDINKDKKVEKTLYSKQEIDSTWNRLYLTHKLQSINFFVRFIMWCLIAFAPPWAFMGLTRWILKKRNNNWIVTYLIIIILIGVASSWPLLMSLGALLDFGTIFFFLILAGAVAKVNYDALDYIERRLL